MGAVKNVLRMTAFVAAATLVCSCGRIPFRDALEELVNTTVAPVFNPAGGSFDTDQTVTITSTTADAAIYYTLDGSEPSASSTLYTGPVPVNGVVAGTANVSLKAIAVKSGLNDSSVTTEAYAITYGWHKVTDLAAWGQRCGFGAVVYNNKMYVIGGMDVSGVYHNSIHSSTNGANWIADFIDTAPSASVPVQRYRMAVTATPSAIWMIGGLDALGNRYADAWLWNGAWSKTTSNLSSGRDLFPALNFGGNIWVSGGLVTGSPYYIAEVAHSSDGSSWTTATSLTSSRGGHSMIVFNGSMWVLGGAQFGGIVIPSNDVLETSDGTSWSTAPVSGTRWTARFGHTSVSYGGLMWVICGSVGDLGGPFSKEVWYSSDGSTWNQLPVPSDFTARAFHASVVYQNRLWVMGGQSGVAAYLSDVWYYGP